MFNETNYDRDYVVNFCSGAQKNGEPEAIDFTFSSGKNQVNPSKYFHLIMIFTCEVTTLVTLVIHDDIYFTCHDDLLIVMTIRIYLYLLMFYIVYNLVKQNLHKYIIVQTSWKLKFLTFYIIMSLKLFTSELLQKLEMFPKYYMHVCVRFQSIITVP